MDILSFILGMALVVVIAIAIVAVRAFVRVREITEELSSIHQVIGNEIDNQNRLRENDRRDFETTIDNVYRSLDEKANLINRVMDSRFDKLENKFQEQVKK
jgi:hypothetical protein